MAQTATVEIQMPAMGESVTEGTVLEWHVSEGDRVSEGDTVVEVSTDKVDAEVPAPADGVITKLLVDVDDVVDVGKPLAEMESGDAADASGNGAGATTAGTAEPEQGEDHPPAADAERTSEGGSTNGGSETATTDDASVSAGETTAEGALQIVMPEMGESVTEGTVLEWHVSEGDSVEEGQTVVEVSTDKDDAEVPAPASVTITKLLVDVDDVIEVGKPLAEVTPGEGGQAEEKDAVEEAEEGAAEEPEADGADGARATPVARRIAAERGVDLNKVNGSGAGGKVTKEDVLAAADGKGAPVTDGKGKAAPAAPAPSGESKPLRGPAAMLAKAMEESRSIPTATSFRAVAVDTLDAKRKALNGVLKERAMKVSFTHLVAWAIVQAAKEWPVMARSFAEQDGKPFVNEAATVNLGIAVDVERKDRSRSLMVPVI